MSNDVANLYQGSGGTLDRERDLRRHADDQRDGLHRAQTRFNVKKGAGSQVLDAGAFEPVAGGYQSLRSSLDRRVTASPSSLERTLRAGDIAYAETSLFFEYERHGGPQLPRRRRGRVPVPAQAGGARAAGAPPPPAPPAASDTLPTAGQMAQMVKGSLGASGSSLRPLRLPRLAKRQSLLLPFAFPEAGTVKLDLVAKGQTIGTGTKSSTANGKVRRLDQAHRRRPQAVQAHEEDAEGDAQGHVHALAHRSGRAQRGRDRHTQAMTRRLLTALFATVAVAAASPAAASASVCITFSSLPDAPAARRSLRLRRARRPVSIEIVRGGAVIASGSDVRRAAPARAGRHARETAIGSATYDGNPALGDIVRRKLDVHRHARRPRSSCSRPERRASLDETSPPIEADDQRRLARAGHAGAPARGRRSWRSSPRSGRSTAASSGSRRRSRRGTARTPKPPDRAPAPGSARHDRGPRRPLRCRAALAAARLKRLGLARLGHARDVSHFPFTFSQPGTVRLKLLAHGKVIGTGTKTAGSRGAASVTVTLTAAGPPAPAPRDAPEADAEAPR